ncbi:MAG: hypothetical protein KC646_13545 [Candidatus Cloacimonetes bacterium]|nr:hypothetical protein [Candidatus Cloacimonadota bacterium]
MKKTLLACGLLILSGPQDLKASETEIEVHGYMSRGYMKSDKYNYLAENSKDSTTKWGEIGINFGYQAHDRLRFGAQILARELGNAGEYNPELDWGFADYKLTDYASVKFGKFFVPWGLYNEGRDVDILRNSILPIQAVYNEDFRDISLLKGLELHGSFELGERNSIDYRLAKGNVDINSGSSLFKDVNFSLNKSYSAAILQATAGAVNIANPVNSLDLNINGMTAYGLVWNTWVDGLRLGFTSMEPDIDINAQVAVIGPQYTKYDFTENFEVSSVEYTKDQWTYSFEKMTYLINAVTSTGSTPFLKNHAYYHQINYRLNDRYELGLVRQNDYSNVLKGKNTINLYQNDLAFTVRVDMSEDWVLKLEYHDLEGTALLRDILNPGVTAAVNQGKDWDMIMAKVTYSF